MFDNSDLKRWKTDPVTVSLLKVLTERLEDIESACQDESILLADAQTRALLVGERRALQTVLDIQEHMLNELGDSVDE